MKKLLLSLLLLFHSCTPAPALADEGDKWLAVTVASKHFGGDVAREYNEKNWGLGFEMDVADRWKATAGWFRNSNRIDSMYLLAAHCTAQWRVDWGRVCLGLAGGMVSGYDVDLLPVVLPVGTVEWRRSLGANISYFRTRESDAHVIGLQVKTTGKWEPLK